METHGLVRLASAIERHAAAEAAKGADTMAAILAKSDAERAQLAKAKQRQIAECWPLQPSAACTPAGYASDACRGVPAAVSGAFPARPR